MRSTLLFVLLPLLLVGCTRTRVLMPDDFAASYESVNLRLEGRTARIVLHAEGTTYGQQARFTADSLFWLSSETGLRQARALGAVEEVSYERAGRGLFVGAALGAAAGLYLALTPLDEKTPQTDVIVGVDPAFEPVAIAGLMVTSVVLGLLGEGRRRFVVYRHPRR